MSGPTLATRVPGESLMEALHAAMTPEPPRTFSARLFGRDPIPASARGWYTGLLGELTVAERLRSLPDGWLVLHSVPVGDRGSDIDHVLVSPSGRVVTVNTKHSPRGRVWVSPSAFLVNGQRRPYLRNSAHEAARAARLLSGAAGAGVDVLPVIVVVAASLTRRGDLREVEVVTPRELLGFLERRLAPSRGAADVEDVRRVSALPQTWSPRLGAPATTAAHLEWFLDLRDRVRSAARRRNAWVLAALLGTVGVPVGALAVAAGTVLQ